MLKKYYLDEFFWVPIPHKRYKNTSGFTAVLLNIHVYHKWRSYDTWFLKYKVQKTEIFIILGHFFPFRPLTTWKIKILTLKKTPGDITILHISPINDNHMMYGSWNMERNRKCALFPPYGPGKSKFWKKWKNFRRYYHFTNVCHRWQYYDV